MNTLVHEKFHIDNHLNVITTIGKGSVEHLKAYNAQIGHSTWERTTAGHQKDILKKNNSLY